MPVFRQDLQDLHNVEEYTLSMVHVVSQEMRLRCGKVSLKSNLNK